MLIIIINLVLFKFVYASEGVLPRLKLSIEHLNEERATSAGHLVQLHIFLLKLNEVQR